jgi:hypothetical protein
MNTLETGAGHTTVAFCIAGARHIAVTPDAGQAERIRSYLAEHAIPAEPTFVQESSDTALPATAGLPERLDFVFIDGAHRFPFPMIDWHYTEARVPVGGIVAVDDSMMPSVRILYDFLVGEDDWELIEQIHATAMFRRVRKSANMWDWADQNINKEFHARVTAGVGVELELQDAPSPDAASSAPDAEDGAGAETALRGARLQIKAMQLQMRALERDQQATQLTLQRVRSELWAIKSSRSHKLLALLRRIFVDPARRVKRRLLRRRGAQETGR